MPKRSMFIMILHPIHIDITSSRSYILRNQGARRKQVLWRLLLILICIYIKVSSNLQRASNLQSCSSRVWRAERCHYNSVKLMNVLLLDFGPFALFGGKIRGFRLLSGWLLLSRRYFDAGNLESGSEQSINQ